MNQLHPLETIGNTQLAVDKNTHELVLIVRTHLGMVSQALSSEKACQLGIALVRESGKTFNFSKTEENDTLLPSPTNGASEKKQGDSYETQTTSADDQLPISLDTGFGPSKG